MKKVIAICISLFIITLSHAMHENTLDKRRELILQRAIWKLCIWKKFMPIKLRVLMEMSYYCASTNQASATNHG